MNWTILTRGTHRAELCPYEIDVFMCNGTWRYNILNTVTECYEASQDGYYNINKCKEDAENCARFLVHTIIT